jgi:hypothetical protein
MVHKALQNPINSQEKRKKHNLRTKKKKKVKEEKEVSCLVLNAKKMLAIS